MNGISNPSFEPDGKAEKEKDPIYDDVAQEEAENSGGGYEVPLNVTDVYSSVTTPTDAVPDAPPPSPPCSPLPLTDADSVTSQNTVSDRRLSRGSSSNGSVKRLSIRRNTSIKFSDRDDSFDLDRRSSITENGSEVHRIDLRDDGSGESADSPIPTSKIGKGYAALRVFIVKNKRLLQLTAQIVVHLCVAAYSVVAGLHWIHVVQQPLSYCSGFGLLIVILVVVYGTILWRTARPHCVQLLAAVQQSVKRNVVISEKICRILSYLATATIVLALLALLLYDTYEELSRLVSFLGAVVLLSLGYIFSTHPARVRWRTVINGLLLQLVLGILVIRWTTGNEILQCLSDKVVGVLSCGEIGAEFVYGQLEAQKIFAFSALPIIFFLGSLVQVLYYLGWAQRFLVWLGTLIQFAMSTTPIESVNAVATTLVGQAESSLLIGPYIKDLTASEIHAVMAAGLATTGGMLFAAYVQMGANPSHLVTSSILSAPAALCFSKLIHPETEKTRTSRDIIIKQTSDDTSLIDALSKGAQNGIALVLSIIANVVAFVSLVQLTNGVLQFLGGLVGMENLELELIFSKIFIPLAWLMGVQADQCSHVAALIGLKTVINEYVAFRKLGEMKKMGLLSERSEAIATYAICGFTNPGALGITISCLTAAAPNQRTTICNVSLRAFVAASATCFLTACLAGLLLPVKNMPQLQTIPGNRTNATFMLN